MNSILRLPNDLDPFARLVAARRTLAGMDVRGDKIWPGMFDDGVVSLAHGDGTRRPPVRSLRAAAEMLSHTCGWSFDDYHFNREYLPLLQAIREKQAGVGADPASIESLYVDAGSSRIFSTFFHLFLQEDDLVLIPQGFYHGTLDWLPPDPARLHIVPVPPRTNKLTAEHLSETCYELARHRRIRRTYLLLTNPTFTGAVYSPAELYAIEDAAISHEIFVLYDLAFAGTEFADCPASVVRKHTRLSQRSLAVGTVSKSHNLANIRVGWCSGPKGIVDAMRDHREKTMGAVPFLTQAMAAAALVDDDVYLKINAQECIKRVELIKFGLNDVTGALTAAGVDAAINVAHDPGASHSVLVNLRTLSRQKKQLTSLDLCAYMLKHAGLAISPGYSMGFSDLEFRIAYGSVGLHGTYAAETCNPRKQLSIDMSCLEEAFATGRSVLKSALFDRLLPALVAMFRQNAM
ncbi:pyridoxal phosphate-dependent aminotransferase [Rhizobium leguminosarum]|uniref:pyridoxal phosphate-dependent aminotransferase n=1 Tax=Rhizobium leguminosarum TaxID=384 RepID=UPI003F980CE5